MKALSLAAVLIALAGCASTPKLNQRLSSAYVGQPVSAMHARYGSPSVSYTMSKGTTLVQWGNGGSYTGTRPGVYATTGVVAGQPFTATTVGGSVDTAGFNGCLLTAFVNDETQLVTTVGLEGSGFDCRRFQG